VFRQELSKAKVYCGSRAVL